MTTMLRPMRSSGWYHSAMPERIWRFSYPRSTSRRRSLSALGMRSATMIFATRRSILTKSSMAICVVACGASEFAAAAFAKGAEAGSFGVRGSSGALGGYGGTGGDVGAGVLSGK